MFCTKCDLYKNSKKPCIQGVGNKSAKLMVIGMNPGIDEDKQGIPFVGTAGQELNKVLDELGIKREEIFISNAIRCRTPDNREPTKQETEACIPYLVDEIKEIKPNIILLLGNYVCKYLLGKTGITKLRGKPFWSAKFQATLVPAFHPSYLARRRDDVKTRENFVNDIAFAYNSSKTENFVAKSKQATHYVVCDTIVKVNSLLKRLSQVKEFAIDLETTSLDPAIGKVLCISFSWQEATAAVLPLYEYVKGDVWEQSDLETIKNKLRDILANDKIGKIFQNGKYDCKWLKYKLNMYVEGFIFDTMIAHYLIDSTNRKHRLEELSYTYTDMGGYDAEITHDKENGFRNTPPEKIYQLAGGDADCTFRLRKVFEKDVQPYLHIMQNILIPLSLVLGDVEYLGVKIDKNRVKQLLEEIKPQLTKLEEEMSNFPQVKKYIKEKHEAALQKAKLKYLNSKTLRRRHSIDNYLAKIEKPKVNFKSSPQLRKILYDYIKLTPIGKTKRTHSFSTDEKTLKLLQGKHKIIDLLLSYRGLYKVYSTYLIPMLEKPDKNDRLHTEYRLTRTYTGRLASRNINLQNIPKKPFIAPDGEKIELGKMIRECFIPSENNILVEPDLKQVEFRILGHYANDSQMLEDIKNKNTDPHRLIAAQAFKKKPEDITFEERRKAKSITFGVPYGRGAKAIAEDFNMSVEDAEKLTNGYFERYPGALKWINGVKRGIKKYKYVKTLFGRKRALPDADSEHEQFKNRAEREAIATVIQSTASDILSIYTVNIYKRLQKEGYKSKIVLTIHDSLVLDVPKVELQKIIPLLKEEMSRPIKNLRVPIEAEVCVGNNWGTIKEQKIDTIEELNEGDNEI